MVARRAAGTETGARLTDVARRAGVSTMTVARVLRQPEKVAPATRARVSAALDAAQYTPDLVARALASRRSGTIGAVVPTLSNSLIAEVIQGMSDELALTGRQLILGASGFSAVREEALVRTFLARRVDGLYLTGTSHTEATLRMLGAATIPVVEGGNLTDNPIQLVVGASNVEAAATVVRHLIARHGTDVAFVGASPVDNDRMRDRRTGYARAMAEAGARPRAGRIVECPMTMVGGREAMARLLARKQPPRAVFCATDVIAVGAVQECVRRGVQVPGTIAIAGYDDLDVARELVPALTTVRMPRYEIGQTAARLMDRCLAGDPPAQRIHDLGFEFVPRESA
jgi:LacI family transcriptional regulator, gluconate utilization system Gnt-I transcriptional repressor